MFHGLPFTWTRRVAPTNCDTCMADSPQLDPVPPTSKTVAEILGLPEVAAIESYTMGREQVGVRVPVPRSATPRLTAEAIDEKLDPYREDAVAGVTDEMLAKRTELTPHQVARWRRRHSIERTPGRRSREEHVRIAAVELFGRPRDPAVMKTSGGALGTWQVPEYLLRDPLDYSCFAEVCTHALEAGVPQNGIAAGLGVRVEDVQHAVALWRARGGRR